MTAVLAAGGVATLVSGFIVMGTAGTAQADDNVPCGTPAQEAVYKTIQHPAVPAVYETAVVKEAWTETVLHPAEYQTVTIPAVVTTKLVPDQRWSWNPLGPAGESEAAPAWPVPAQGNWTPNTSHHNGTDPLGVVFQEGEGNGGDNASWFYWTSETIEVLVEPERTETRLVKEAWTEMVEHPAVTEQRLVSPGVPAWTEQKLVTPAVPAGPPCEDDETPPPPVKDVCTNLNGVQPDVPKGYTEQDGICTEIEVLPTEALDVCSNIKGAQAAVPAGLEAEDGRCVRPAEEKPDEVVGPDEVLGTAEAVPTAVDAGLGGPTVTTASTSSPLGQGLVGAGLVMLLLAGAMQMGRARGAHQA